jgi:hypothetical protein
MKISLRNFASVFSNDRFSSLHFAAFNYRFEAVCVALIFVPHKVPHHFVTFLSRKK